MLLVLLIGRGLKLLSGLLLGEERFFLESSNNMFLQIYESSIGRGLKLLAGLLHVVVCFIVVIYHFLVRFV